jgi:hypothetical protein
MLLLALALALALPGCVSRKLFLRSEPAGARVILDGRAVGVTPYEEEVHTYGTHVVELELDGHARRRELIELPLPWWQVFPLDIVTDLLLPFTIHDDHAFDFELLAVHPEEGTRADADAAFARLRAALSTSAAPALPAPVPASPAPAPPAEPQP